MLRCAQARSCVDVYAALITRQSSPSRLVDLVAGALSLVGGPDGADYLAPATQGVDWRKCAMGTRTGRAAAAPCRPPAPPRRRRRGRAQPPLRACRRARRGGRAASGWRGGRCRGGGGGTPATRGGGGGGRGRMATRGNERPRRRCTMGGRPAGLGFDGDGGVGRSCLRAARTRCAVEVGGVRGSSGGGGGNGGRGGGGGAGGPRRPAHGQRVPPPRSPWVSLVCWRGGLAGGRQSQQTVAKNRA